MKKFLAMLLALTVVLSGLWNTGLDGAELTDGSYLIVEGAFENADNGYIMNISKTYVLADDDALVYSETEPVLETEYALTGLTNHPNGWNADGIYITHDAHNATIGTDWSVRYRPVSAEVIKLVRGGETFNIGIHFLVIVNCDSHFLLLLFSLLL